MSYTEKIGSLFAFGIYFSLSPFFSPLQILKSLSYHEIQEYLLKKSLSQTKPTPKAEDIIQKGHSSMYMSISQLTRFTTNFQKGQKGKPKECHFFHF